MGKFVITHTPAGYFFNLKANNYETILTASEVYSSAEACKTGIASVCTNAPIAALEDQTAADFAQQKNPKFEVYEDNRGEFRFRLKARNGETIGKSEAYTTKASCLNGVESVRKNAPTAIVEPEE